MSAIDMNTFPFAAVCGMEDAKRAIMCALVNRRIRTVLIRGCPGTAKTTLARASGSLIGKRVINIPLNVTDEQLFGGMDIDATIKEGKPKIQKGLLSEADGCILYIDDINLIDRKTLTSLLDCVTRGKVILEREGISGEYAFDTLLIATMNPSDSDISSHLLDRFDLCAYSSSEDEEDIRIEIIRRNVDQQKDPAVFTELYAEEKSDITKTLETASKLIPIVTISDDLMGLAAELTAKLSVDGFRGDLAMINSSLALAALNGRDEVIRKDVEEAAMICLAHRRNYSSEQPQSPADHREDIESSEDGRDEPEEKEDTAPQQPFENKDDGCDPNKNNKGEEDDFQSLIEDMIFEAGKQFRVIDYLENGVQRTCRVSGSKGRRDVALSSDTSGRYIRSRVPNGRAHDIAIDATIRAASPYQLSREHESVAISIKKQDIREKVRERRTGCTILFLVDASGSLGVRRRMSTVKGAVLSMLRDSYVKRDKIGLMAFRKESAEMILPPTRSVEYSYRKMEELPTGGKTPLGEALIKVSEFMTSYSRSHPGEMCYVVLITDGRANVPIQKGADANEEAIKLATEMSVPRLKWVVIDASTGYIRFDNANRLANELGGTYIKLEDLNAETLAEGVKSVIR